MLKMGLVLIALVSGMNAMADEVVWSCQMNGNPDALTISSLDPAQNQYGIKITVTNPELQEKLGAGFLAEGDGNYLRSQTEDFALVGGEYERIDVSFVNGGVNFQLNSCREAGCEPNPQYSYFFNYGQCVKH